MVKKVDGQKRQLRGILFSTEVNNSQMPLEGVFWYICAASPSLSKREEQRTAFAFRRLRLHIRTSENADKASKVDMSDLSCGFAMLHRPSP